MSIRHGILSGYLHHKCRCAPCTRAKRLYQQELRAGIRRPLIDATEAAGHLQALQAAGWSWAALARHTGYEVGTISRIGRGERDRIRQATAEDILSIPIEEAA